MNRLKVFDHYDRGKPLNYPDLLAPGNLSIIDLSDSGMPELNNIVIADVLRGVPAAQDKAYKEFESGKKQTRRWCRPRGP